MNLPKTGFPMRAGLSKSEPKRLKDWQDNKVYEQVLKKNEGHKKFVLHDGPPYANGPIHIGHAMNKISKDMINRYWMMQGYEVPYVPGWDCHGQPIEHKVEEKLGTEKFNQTPTAKIRELCNEFAVENIELQKAGFRRLGVLGDWDNPYLTLYHQHDAADIEVFKAMFDKGMIYRGHKPVHWCKHCHTALAEAEIEYSDETSPSIFVRFEMTSKPAGLENFDGPVDFIIWTTTPWTIPSDQAVSLKPGAAYVAVEHEGRAEVMLEDLAPKCCEEFGWEYTPVMVDGKPYVVPAETFHHIHYKQPIFDGVEGVALLADYVGVDDGTGIVHNSPGHGVDDYFACLKEGITDICMPVDDDGKFYTGEEFGTGGPFSGMDTDEANPHIIRLWSQVENAAMTAVRERTEVALGRLVFQYQSGMLFIALSSGRKLCYVKPRIQTNRFGGDGLTYEGIGESRKWTRIETFGGKLTENIVQATARDLLAEAMLRLRDAGFEIVMHVHDEAVLEVPIGKSSVEEVCALMAEAPAWADGLPLRADGYECEFYKKD